jgi:hypothetical protein
MSRTSPGKIGTRADDLAQAIRESMTVHARAGVLSEVIETRALMARRAIATA